MTAERTTRRVCTTAAALFIAFAVWGSLFPFDFHAVTWSDAIARFWSPWDVPPSRWSLSDFASNVLLFVPIGLCAMAAAGSGAGPGVQPGLAALTRRLYASACVLAASIVLSTAIELAQAFVPWRTPSVVDVGAETIGAMSGIVLWWGIGGRLEALLAAGALMVRRSPVRERLLLVYCAIFAAAWLVPADFTLRPNEIADKYAHQRLLLPFAPSPDAATGRDLTMIGVAAMPIGVTATLCGCNGIARRPFVPAALIATTFLVGLEAAQIFVFSRTTDATALVVAAGAAVMAAMLASVAGRRRPRTVAG
ncbi:MAG TPA: VanZ family protein [Vicinamibacterales bacterium]|nr:VanZ family protein [Vicinamibacterales bacterium]